MYVEIVWIFVQINDIYCIIMLICRLNVEQQCRRLLRCCNPTITYSRQYFEELAVDREAIRQKELQEQNQRKKQMISNIKSNDRNPRNHIPKLKINSPAFAVVQEFRNANMINQCAILTPEKPKQKVLISAIRKYIITSIKKAQEAMWPAKKKHILDAIHFMEQSHKKVAKIMLPTFYNLIRHAIDQGKDPIRLFVSAILIGKTIRYKGIRYHAKGKTGKEKKDICQIKIILEERNQEEFFQDIGKGCAPPGFATYIRDRLIEVNPSHQLLVQYGSITTAKGRQQKRQILKRKAAGKMIENQKQGEYTPRKTIMKQLIEQEGIKAKQLYQKLKETGMSQLQKRQALLAQNMKDDN